MKINLKSLVRTAGKIVVPVAKASVPIVAVAIITHQPVKKALEDAARNAVADELAKRVA